MVPINLNTCLSNHVTLITFSLGLLQCSVRGGEEQPPAGHPRYLRQPPLHRRGSSRRAGHHRWALQHLKVDSGPQFGCRLRIRSRASRLWFTNRRQCRLQRFAAGLRQRQPRCLSSRGSTGQHWTTHDGDGLRYHARVHCNLRRDQE
jgi:hypothetical protein